MTTVDDRHEEGYVEGSTRAWLTVLSLALTNLGHAAPDSARLVNERAEAISQLRSICRDHGDNDWEDNLHLSDIIEKHLARHLYSGEKRGRQ